MGELIQIRDYQSPKDLDRMQRELEKEAAAILESVPFGGAGIDGMTFTGNYILYTTSPTV